MKGRKSSNKSASLLTGNAFDFDNDGKLGIFEQAVETRFFQMMMEDDAPKKPEEPYCANVQIDYTPTVESSDTWQEKYRDTYLLSASLLDPDLYDTEEDYLQAVEEENVLDIEDIEE